MTPTRITIAGKEYDLVPVPDQKPGDPTIGHQPLPWRWANERRWFLDKTDLIIMFDYEPNRALVLRWQAQAQHFADLVAFVERVFRDSSVPGLVGVDAMKLLERVREAK